MYGDTEVIRALARQLRERGREIRAEADDLLRSAEAVPWSGLAADAMRRLADEHAGGLRSCSDAHDAAAESLERHAREVDHLKELIAEAERRVFDLFDSLPDDVAHWVHHFDPPSHGSLEWLDVRVPA
ncbi:MAG: WXG100 family type VII secretion target [Nocardioides sp.]|nr:WXG100 family type VII secretion target [Nocardioides sp.]